MKDENARLPRMFFDEWSGDNVGDDSGNGHRDRESHVLT